MDRKKEMLRRRRIALVGILAAVCWLAIGLGAQRLAAQEATIAPAENAVDSLQGSTRGLL
jgi:hypothetical protein